VVVVEVQTVWQADQVVAVQRRLCNHLAVLGLLDRVMQVVAVTTPHMVVVVEVVGLALLAGLQMQAVHQQVMVVLASQTQ
jgi:hypothetical protein